MTATAFLLILLSLLLHSLWHFLCKSSRKASMTFFALFSTALLLTVFSIGVWSGVLFQVPWRVFRYAMLGAAFGVAGEAGLILAYRTSDISLVYPMATALPVLLTLLVTRLCGWGEPLSAAATAGMVAIFCGCLAMSLSGGDPGSSLRQKFTAMRKGLPGIFITAVSTTGYTVFDSFGIRNIMEFAAGGDPILTAAAYSTCRESVAMVSLWLIVGVNCRRERGREELKTLRRSAAPYLAGVFAALSYLLVLVAMLHVTNVSFVQALRQLSLPVSAALGFIILKEKPSTLRLGALALILAGLGMCILR